MSAGFRHNWFGDRAIDQVEAAQRDGLNEAAADGERMMKSPAPTGWPRRTGLLASTAGFDEAERDGDGYVARLTIGTDYWIYVNAKTETLQRAGEAVMKTVPQRVKARMP